MSRWEHLCPKCEKHHPARRPCRRNQELAELAAYRVSNLPTVRSDAVEEQVRETYSELAHAAGLGLEALRGVLFPTEKARAARDALEVALAPQEDE